MIFRSRASFCPSFGPYRSTITSNFCKMFDTCCINPQLRDNGATDIHGVYGYYITDAYPFAPICTFGVHEPSFGKVPPLRWHDETPDNTIDDNGDRINGH